MDVVVVDRNWANELRPRLSALRVELRGCRLTGVELAEATLRDVTFRDCRVDLAGLRNARLERVVFSDCRMSDASCTCATLTDVLFERCALRAANLSTMPAFTRRDARLRPHGLAGGEALRAAHAVRRRARERGRLRVGCRRPDRRRRPVELGASRSRSCRRRAASSRRGRRARSGRGAACSPGDRDPHRLRSFTTFRRQITVDGSSLRLVPLERVRRGPIRVSRACRARRRRGSSPRP